MTKHRNLAYSEEYCREAVRRSELPNQTTASVAKDLGISAQQIYNWKRQFNRLSDKLTYQPDARRSSSLSL